MGHMIDRTQRMNESDERVLQWVAGFTAFTGVVGRHTVFVALEEFHSLM